MREDTKEAERPKRGRPSKPKSGEQLNPPPSQRLTTPSDRFDDFATPSPSNDNNSFPPISTPHDATSNQNKLTQPLITNDKNSSSGRSPVVWRPPTSSPAVAHGDPRPHGTAGNLTSPAAASDNQPSSAAENVLDDFADLPTPVYHPQLTPPTSYVPEGRPKRNTKMPVKYQDYETYATRSF